MDTRSEQTLNGRTDTSKRILVVEDEAEIRQLVVLHLRREGFLVDEEGDGEAARKLAETRTYNLIMLDWMLPSMSGLDLTKWIRRRPDLGVVPILLVTARTEPEHIAAGLNAGADDYLTKPFDPLVLMARVNALLRRHDWLRAHRERPTAAAGDSRITAGALTIDTQTYDVQLDGGPLELTRSEFRLLESLMSNQGKVLSREALIGEIQGENVNVVGRTVDTHVFGLRKKLGIHADLIETIRGVGYRVRYAPLG